MRENVFTRFAKEINRFSKHEINKEQLFDTYISMLEMCDASEKNQIKFKFDYEHSIVKPIVTIENHGIFNAIEIINS